MSASIPGLTHRQQMVLDFIRSSITERGFAPTLREIGDHLGVVSTNGVNDHLKALVRKGWLVRDKLKSRTIRLAASPAPSRQQEVLGQLRAMAGWVREDPICGVVAAALDHLIVLMTQRYPETT
jgi:repressor LexA